METSNFDYALTEKGIYIQTGNKPTTGTFLGVPIYAPDLQGTRTIAGAPYSKIPVNQTSQLPPQFVSQHRDDLSPIVCEFPRSNIQKTFRHAAFEPSGELADVLGIAQEVIGKPLSVFGSVLLGTETPESDWDVLVYGVGGYVNIRERWKNLKDALHATDAREYTDERIERYASMHAIDVAKLAPVFKRRRSALILPNGRRMSFSCVYAPGEDAPEHLVERHEGVRFWGVERVVDDTHSTMMPRLYRGEAHDIISFRWMDADVVRNDERVEIKGTLLPDERTIILNERGDYVLPVQTK